MQKEPIRHHYIPQFILRNFAYDNNKKLICYYNKESQFVSERETCEVFMERNLYRDEINYTSTPVQIEHDLSVYEREVAELIKGKFLNERKIELTIEEAEKLKLFFAIMSFRNINAKDQFCEKASLGFKEFYEQFQKNKNLEDFWKRNLGFLVNCRSIKDIEKHTKIDPPVKLFMQRDIDGLYGRYIAVVESKEDDSFILGDCYPLVFFGDPNRIPLYDICPISPKRAIIIASKGVDNVPCNVLTLRKGVFDLPKINENNNYVIITKRLHSDEVEFVNTEITKNSHKGFIFSELNNIK